MITGNQKILFKIRNFIIKIPRKTPFSNIGNRNFSLAIFRHSDGEIHPVKLHVTDKV